MSITDDYEKEFVKNTEAFLLETLISREKLSVPLGKTPLCVWGIIT